MHMTWSRAPIDWWTRSVVRRTSKETRPPVSECFAIGCYRKWDDSLRNGRR